MTARSRPTAAVDNRRLSAPALRTFLRIADLWGLSVAERMTILAVTSRSTFLKWSEDPNVVLPGDTLERISCVLGIHKALQSLFPDERAADDWIRRPNTSSLFGGRSALDRMLSGQVADLFVVRRYLDAQVGGWT